MNKNYSVNLFELLFIIHLNTLCKMHSRKQQYSTIYTLYSIVLYKYPVFVFQNILLFYNSINVMCRVLLFICAIERLTHYINTTFKLNYILWDLLRWYLKRNHKSYSREKKNVWKTINYLLNYIILIIIIIYIFNNVK